MTMRPSKEQLIEASVLLGTALGVTPFPVREKQPLTPQGSCSWKSGAQCWNQQLYELWWREAVDPDGIGVVLPAPYVVVDLDPQVVGGEQSTAYLLARDELTAKLTDLAVRRLGLPASAPRVLTGKGMHIWVRLRNGTTPSSQEVNHLLRGAVLDLPIGGTGELVRVQVHADLKGNGTGYVVCPPSWSEAGQRCYEWICQPRSRDDIPEWSPEDSLIAPLVAVWTPGRRHHLALCTAGVMAKAGLPQERAEELVRRVAELKQDDELLDRIQAVRDTYRKYASREEILGRAGLEVVLSSDELPAVNDALDSIVDRWGDKGARSIAVYESEGSWALCEIVATLPEFTSVYRYVEETGSWLHWTGRVWRDVPLADAVVAGRKALLNYAVGQLYDLHLPRDQKQRLHRLIGWCNDEQKPYNMLNLLTTVPELKLSLDQCDSNPMLLNTPNGVVDLETGHLLEHSPDYYMTRITNAEYHPEAEHELLQLCVEHLKRCIREVEGSDSNSEAFVGYIQRALGYTLTGGVDEQTAFLVIGPPCSGKSTFFELCRHALGSYATVLPLDALYAAKQAEPDRPRPSLATLPGKRMVIASEGSARGHLDTEMFKRLTGTDTIAVRPLYKRPFSFQAQCKLWIATNPECVPRVSFTDSAAWRRIVRITFGYPIPEAEQDKGLLRRFTQSPEALAALLVWMVQGCLEWQRCGLRPPEVIRRHTHELRLEMDPLQEFRDTYLEFGEGYITEAKRLRDLYESTTRRPISNRAWGEWLRANGCISNRVTIDRRQVKVWRGVRIKDDPDAPAPVEVDLVADDDGNDGDGNGSTWTWQ